MDELLERDAELAGVAERATAAVDGRGAVVLLEGPAGIGKTAVLRRARAVCEAHGLRVLSATASELDRAFAFGLVHQLLDPVLAAASGAERDRLLAGAAARAGLVLDPSADASVDGDPSHAVLHGLLWFVLNAADDRPLALLVDDLHWADRPSLRFLEFLGRRVEEAPVLVVATSRIGEPGADAPLLAALADGPVAAVLRPAPLTADAAGALVGDALGGAPDPAFAGACRDATGGNPLLLRELARAAADAGMAGAPEDVDRVAALGSAGIAAVVGRRLRSLGEDAIAVARAAAVLGERAVVDDLAAAAGLDTAAAAATADELVEAQLLEQERWGFVHPLVRAAVANAIPPAERSRLHALAAERLAARGARVDEIAVHLLATEPAGDPATVAMLVEAATRARLDGATDVAVGHLRRALAEPPPPEDRAGLLLRLGELEAAAGDPQAREHLTAALDAGLPAADAARARSTRAALVLTIAPDAALADLDAALADVPDGPPRARVTSMRLELTAFLDAFVDERARLLADARGRAGLAPDAAPDVAALAAAVGDGRLERPELAHLAVDAAYRMAPAAHTEALARAALGDRDLLRALGPDSGTVNLLMLALRHAERPEPAFGALDEQEAEARRRGSRFGAFYVDHARGYLQLMFGSLTSAEGHARTGLEVARGAGLATSVASLSALLAELLVERDAPDDAERLLAATTLTELLEHSIVGPDVLGARGAVAWARGRRDDAEQAFRRGAELLAARGWTAPFKSRCTHRLALLLAERGARDEALALADADVRHATRAGAPGAHGAALRVRAHALESGTVEQLEEAVAVLRTSALPVELGWALHDLGAFLRRGGHRADARAPLREALDVAGRTGATLLDRQVREELLAAGARPRRTALSGVASLTPSERRTAELAAQGLGNREIAETLWVTRKTVELHLGRTYAKLGIRSRAQLPEALKAGEDAGVGT